MRARLYPLLGLLLAALIGAAVLAALSVARGPAACAVLWITGAALLALAGWIFGRREDRLRRMSMSDPLTGLLNRRELERRLSQERAGSARHGVPLSLLMIDVDRLKQINDQGGHRAGDRALLAVADALRRSCRAGDIPARVGGDEFAVLAPATGARGAAPLAARLQRALRAGAAHGGAAVTVSIGIADLDSAARATASIAEVVDERDLVDAADRALYRAKSDGRNRVALHGGGSVAGPAAMAGRRPSRSALRVLRGGAA